MDYNKYHKEYNKTRYHERMILAKTLLGNKCCRCNSVENLEIDHIDNLDKVKGIDYFTRLSMENFLKELSKCCLLCKSCHDVKSNYEKSVNHGQGLSGKRNCSCNLCRARKAEYMKNYMRKRRKFTR